MRYSATFSLFVVLASAPLAAEEPQYERDLKTLIEQRDKAVAAAVEPINRRYQTALEQLLRKATQANELEAALKIKAKLDSVPSAAQPAKPKPKTAEELKEYLDGTTWIIAHGSPDAKGSQTVTFNRNGTVKHSEGPKGELQFLGPRSIKLWKTDAATLNEDLTQFRVQRAAEVYYGTLKR